MADPDSGISLAQWVLSMTEEAGGGEATSGELTEGGLPRDVDCDDGAGSGGCKVGLEM